MSRIDEIKKRMEGMTPGGWEKKAIVSLGGVYFHTNILDDETGSVVAKVGTSANANVLTNAPSDVAFLLRVVEVLGEAHNIEAPPCPSQPATGCLEDDNPATECERCWTAYAEAKAEEAPCPETS